MLSPIPVSPHTLRRMLWATVLSIAMFYGSHTTTAATDETNNADETNNNVCSEEIVSARGEASRFDWIARLKTRANWRRKVRAMPDLGDRYANWYRAKDADENCATGPAGTVCTFTGTPCRKP